MDAIQKIIDAWENYKQDCRPETRNIFLRAFSDAYPALREIEAVDVEGLKLHPIGSDRDRNQIQGWNDCIDHLASKGYLHNPAKQCECTNKQISVDIPDTVTLHYNRPGEDMRTKVSIDPCLEVELRGLWSLGIQTTGCCCGHNGSFPAYIGVKEAFIQEMERLGYVHQRNQLHPDRKDEFVPKTVKCLHNPETHLLIAKEDVPKDLDVAIRCTRGEYLAGDFIFDPVFKAATMLVKK